MSTMPIGVIEGQKQYLYNELQLAQKELTLLQQDALNWRDRAVMAEGELRLCHRMLVKVEEGLDQCFYSGARSVLRELLAMPCFQKAEH